MRINSEKLWDYIFNLGTDEKVRFKVFYDDMYVTEVLWDGENFNWNGGTFTSGAFFNPLYDFEVIEEKTNMKEDWLHIINTFGLDPQLKHWFTEIFELIQAIYKDDGSKDSKKNIASELADNYNFLKQIQTFFEINDEEVEKEQIYKNKRTLEEIKK